MVDPQLKGRYPVRSLHHAIAIAAMCIQEQPTFRPMIGDIVVALDYVVTESDMGQPHNITSSLPSETNGKTSPQRTDTLKGSTSIQ